MAPNTLGLPPGTVYIDDNVHGSKTLSPTPSSDPNEPLNWSPRRKTLHIAQLAIYTLMVFASNTVSTPLYSDMAHEFGYSEMVLDISFAANSAAMAFGSLIFMPFAIVFGRRVVYVVTCAIEFACMVWSACSGSAGSVIGSSVILGLAGSVNESLFQMTATDLFFVHQRGRIAAIYLIMVMLGNFIAPVVSGYNARAHGWRWSFWITTIILGVVLISFLFLLEETKYVRCEGHGLPGENAAAADSDSNTSELPQPVEAKDGVVEHKESLADGDDNKTPPMVSPPKNSYRKRHSFLEFRSHYTAKQFLQLFLDPWRILWNIPVILCGSLVYGFYIAAMNVLAVTQTVLYSEAPYRFSAIGVGNMNISPAIGAILGSAFGGPLMDYLIIQFARRNAGLYHPEMRLRLIFLPAAAMISGIFLYGLTIAEGRPWIINAIGAALMGFGLGGVGDPLIGYLQDSYTKIIGTAFVGATFVANILSTIAIIVLTPWQAGMGTFDMFVLFGCIAFVFSAVLGIIVYYGRSWRIRSAARYYELARRQQGYGLAG